MTDGQIHYAVEIAGLSIDIAIFAFAIYALSRIRPKVNRTLDLTRILVVHTNSLVDKLMEKTDANARAEGIKEGIAQQKELDK